MYLIKAYLKRQTQMQVVFRLQLLKSNTFHLTTLPDLVNCFHFDHLGICSTGNGICGENWTRKWGLGKIWAGKWDLDRPHPPSPPSGPSENGDYKTLKGAVSQGFCSRLTPLKSQ